MISVKVTMRHDRPGGVPTKGDEIWVAWKQVSSVKTVGVMVGIRKGYFRQ